MNKENQDSQGGLIRHDQLFLFETIEEKIEEVNISDIQHFTIVPDYVTPADSKYPFVVKTPSSTNCIDGSHLVEEAVAQGKSTVTCKVEFISEHSDEELAIRKVALRIKPKGGTGSYAEIIRNTQCLEKILLASDKDLRVFHHGGDRKGEGFINNRQENVRKILSFRLGRSVSTINQFLNHARFLDDETLNFFASQKVGKDFFEMVQKINKRGEITRMTSEGKSHEEMTTKISDDTRKSYEEYLRTGKISPIMGTQKNELEAEDSSPEIQVNQVTIPKVINPEVFKPWYGNESGAGDEEDSLEKVKREFKPSAQKLLEAFDLSDLDEFERRIRENLKHLCRIPQRLSPLRSREIRTNSYQEVA
jgi:hypothetical protein